MKIVKTLLISLFLGSTFAIAHEDPSITSAKIAELSAHRIDRLVALGKVDASFAQKMEKIEVTKLSSGPAAYKSTVTQTQPQAGTPLKMELHFDHDGKPLSFKILAGGSAGPDMQWAPKSAGELIEYAMHYVLENSSNATVAPYFASLSHLVLVKGSLNAKTVALVQIISTTQEKPLNVYMNLDGSINSVAVGL